MARAQNPGGEDHSTISWNVWKYNTIHNPEKHVNSYEGWIRLNTQLSIQRPIPLFNGWQMDCANLWDKFKFYQCSWWQTHWRPLAHTAVVFVCVSLCVGRYIKRDNGAKKSCFHGNTYRCVSGWQRDWSSLIQRRCLMHRTQKKNPHTHWQIEYTNTTADIHTAKLQCICYIA